VTQKYKQSSLLRCQTCVVMVARLFAGQMDSFCRPELLLAAGKLLFLCFWLRTAAVMCPAAQAACCICLCV
jgi:hypothetical protein